METANANNLPNVEILANEVICLPIYPELDSNNIEKICNIINE